MKIDTLKDRLNLLKGRVDELNKADGYDDLWDDPEEADSEEAPEDDMASKFLRGEDVSSKSKGSSPGGQEFDLQNNPEHLALMQKIAHHWVKQSEDRRLMRADALKNPVLASEGHRVSAANKVGDPFSKELREHMDSDDFGGKDHLDQLQSLHDFESDWHGKNPDYLKDSLDSLSGAHGKKGDIHDAYTAEQQARDAHMMLGGAASGGIEGSAVAEQANSYAAAVQHVGGQIDDATGQASASVGSDPMTSFANANKEYLADERGKLSPEEVRQRASKVVVAPDNADDSSAYDHPLLKEHKQTIDDFFAQHNKVISGTIKSITKKAIEAGLPESVVDAGALREVGTRGLMQAVSSYDPTSVDAKFSTYASNKMAGMMQTHLSSQNPVPRKTRAKAASFGAKQRAVETAPELAQPETTSGAPKSISAKPDMKSKLSDERHARLKEYDSAKIMRRPKTEE